MPIISFITPVYNTELSLLNRAIQSLLNQTIKDIEILIIDDGSECDVANVCDEYAQNNDKVKVFHQSNKGPAAAKNTGIKNATADWIAYLDADDWVEEDYVENVIDVLKKENLDLLAIGHTDHYSTGETQDVLTNDKRYHKYSIDEKEGMQLAILQNEESLKKYPSFFGAVWSVIYSRRFVIQNKLYNDEKLLRSHDSVYNMYAVEMAGGIGYLNIPLYHYNINMESVCHRRDDRIYAYEYLFQVHRNILDTYKKSSSYYHAFDLFGINMFFRGLGQTYFFNSDIKDSEEIRKVKYKSMLNNGIFKLLFGEVKLSDLSLKNKIIVTVVRTKNYTLCKWLYHCYIKLKKMKRN